MTLVEGVGDEVTQFFIALVIVGLALLAWWSTNISETPLVRTVLVLERRRVEVNLSNFYLTHYITLSIFSLCRLLLLEMNNSKFLDLRTFQTSHLSQQIILKLAKRYINSFMTRFLDEKIAFEQQHKSRYLLSDESSNRQIGFQF